MTKLGRYFNGKHVIVTGGSSGIGLSTAKKLAEAGAELTLVARRTELLESARSEIVSRSPSAKVHLLSLDISKEEAIGRLLVPHIDAHPVHMLINNAAVATPGRFLEQSQEHFRQQMEINFFGAVYMSRAVLPRLVKLGGGHVVNVGSLLSVMAIYGYSSYAATKFALYGFTESLRAEMAPHGIRVSIVLPPDTDTPQHAAELALLPEETKAIAGSVKMLSADQVADAMLEGMAAGKFEIVPGWEGRMTVLANRMMPKVVRWYCDGAQAKVGRQRQGRTTQPQT